VHSLFDVEGRVIIVTGASSGLGEGFARGLHEAGALVVAVGRRRDRLDALVGGLGERSIAVVGDLTSASDRELVLATALERWSKVDVLVNNAGTVLEHHPDGRDESLEEFLSVLDVNLVALFAMTQLVARHMTERGEGGSIVNIGSMFGLVASGGGASYVASKGAVHALTKELAVQWAQTGIRVNAIAPGWFPTALTSHVFDSDQGQSMLRRTVPMGRGGEADELLGALLFLCSDASSYCTGQVLTIDGGYTAK